jgi:hypothetical protein
MVSEIAAAGLLIMVRARPNKKRFFFTFEMVPELIPAEQAGLALECHKL